MGVAVGTRLQPWGRLPAALGAAFLALTGALAAQSVAPANPAPIVYCPPERLAAGPPAAQHVLNVFLPPGAAPATGWPVVVTTGYGGGASVPPIGLLQARGATKPLYDLVLSGIAVVHFGTPGVGNGKGLWFPPGHPRAESFARADDNPEKSAVWALQWAKVQATYPFDLARIGLRGSSGGAVLAIRTAMGPDRARATGSAQVRASTRVAAILALQPPTSVWALEQGPELTIGLPTHLEQAARPGVPAVTLSQVAPELQKDYSLMRVAFQSPEARANNAHQAICLVYGDPVLRIGGQVATFVNDVTGFPVLFDVIKQPTQHDAWFGYAFYRALLDLSPASAAFHGANSVFAVRDVNALPAPFNWHTTTFPGAFSGARATAIGHAWLVNRLLNAPFARGAGAPVHGGSANLPLRGPGPVGQTRPAIALRGVAPGARLELELTLPEAPADAASVFVLASALGRAAEVARAPWPAGQRTLALTVELPGAGALVGVPVVLRALVTDAAGRASLGPALRLDGAR